jgi:hypothetical protein
MSLPKPQSKVVIWCADGTCHTRVNHVFDSTIPSQSSELSWNQYGLTETMYPIKDLTTFFDLNRARHMKMLEQIHDTTSNEPAERYLIRTSKFASSNVKVIWLKINPYVGIVSIRCRRFDNNEKLGVFAAAPFISRYKPNTMFHNDETWLPIPFPSGKDIVITLSVQSAHQMNGNILQGLMFGTNPWNHVTCPAISYRLYASEETKSMIRVSDVNVVTLKGSVTMMVPVIPNGLDKLLYIVHHGTDFLNLGRTRVHVNNMPIESFKHSYSNPFSKFLNGKSHGMYLALKIPANYLDHNAPFVRVRLNTRGGSLHISEIGTHDASVISGFSSNPNPYTGYDAMQNLALCKDRRPRASTDKPRVIIRP